MATFTASEMYGGLKANHTGINVAQSHLHRALSVSEIALLARIPNHATILRLYLSGGTTGNSTGTWSLGFQTPVVNARSGASLTVDSLAAAISLTSSAIYVQPLVGGPMYPIEVSLSDDAVQQFVWIQASVLGSVTATTTSSLRLTVEYVVPGG
jgi:hypothetical protein